MGIPHMNVFCYFAMQFAFPLIIPKEFKSPTPLSLPYQAIEKTKPFSVFFFFNTLFFQEHCVKVTFSSFLIVPFQTQAASVIPFFPLMHLISNTVEKRQATGFLARILRDFLP